MEAQSLADIARRERARQAQVVSTRVINTENAASMGGVASGVTASPGTILAAPKPAAAPVAAPVDPAKKFAEDLEKTRSRVRELQDQETALKVQIS